MASGTIHVSEPSITTSGNWTIVKHPNGRLEMYYRDTSYSFQATNQRGSYFFYDGSFNFPVTVYDGVAFGSVGGNTSTAAPFIANLRPYQASISFSIGSASASTVSSETISIAVFGRWK